MEWVQGADAGVYVHVPEYVAHTRLPTDAVASDKLTAKLESVGRQ